MLVITVPSGVKQLGRKTLFLLSFKENEDGVDGVRSAFCNRASVSNWLHSG